MHHSLYYRVRSLTLGITRKGPGEGHSGGEGAVEGRAFPVEELRRGAGAHGAEVAGAELAGAVVGTVLRQC